MNQSVNTIFNSTPELCIKCGTDKKDKDYPMCYSCFLKWDKDRNFLRGECLIMSDSEDEDEEEEKRIKKEEEEERKRKAKAKLHQELLDFWYEKQYDEFDDRVNIFPALDRHTEFDYDGNEYYCYTKSC